MKNGSDLLAAFPEVMEQVRNTEPVIQAITNFVTVNDCANIILAAGASPTMAHEVAEVAEVASVVQGLVMNMGTMGDLDAMLVAGKAANAAGVPIVLDPVAVSATALRREGGRKLLEHLKFSVIRGNTSEIKHLAVGSGATRGVDAAEEDKITEENYRAFGYMAREFARKTGAVIAVSGVIDIIASADRVFALRNGDAMMSRITGSGCMLTALLGAFCGGNPDRILEAAVCAVALMGVSGEMAREKTDAQGGGTLTFRTNLVDAVSLMDAQTLMERTHLEELDLPEKATRASMKLYAITDRTWLGNRTLHDVTEEVLAAGATFLQIREKELDEAAFLAEAKDLAALAKQYHVPFVVNDHIEIALACGADGVHVGQSDIVGKDVRAMIGPDKILGISANTVETAIKAQQSGADYIGVGAVFHTDTKKDAQSLTNAELLAICKAVTIPVVAIGGINEGNVMQLKGSGVDGISVISAIFAKENPGEATRELLRKVGEMLEE